MKQLLLMIPIKKSFVFHDQNVFVCFTVPIESSWVCWCEFNLCIHFGRDTLDLPMVLLTSASQKTIMFVVIISGWPGFLICPRALVQVCEVWGQNLDECRFEEPHNPDREYTWVFAVQVCEKCTDVCGDRAFAKRHCH